MIRLLMCVLAVSALPEARADLMSTGTTVWDDGIRYLNPDEPDNGEVMPGCSWYCGGVFPSASASSQLKGESYAPGKAHDFDYRTAWVEGVDGSGIGEYLEYRFQVPSSEKKPEDFGINKAVIFNGYRKSDGLWKANGRVKTFKMYVNGVPTAIFNLADSKHPQTAPFPFVALKPGTEVVLRFEILDVYPGDKYRDTAISELLFEGTGVH